MFNTVLIADDSTMVRQMIAETLVDAGWMVVGEAFDGQMAVDLYRHFRPDVVTMDIVMPGMGGLEALDEIIQYDSSARVVMVSEVRKTGLISEAIRKGAQDFVAKPFSAEQLRDTMRIVVEDVPELVVL